MTNTILDIIAQTVNQRNQSSFKDKEEWNVISLSKVNWDFLVAEINSRLYKTDGDSVLISSAKQVQPNQSSLMFMGILVKVDGFNDSDFEELYYKKFAGIK